MSDEENDEAPENELHIWACNRDGDGKKPAPKETYVRLIFRHNCFDELSIILDGEDRELRLAEQEWKVLKHFLGNNH